MQESLVFVYLNKSDFSAVARVIFDILADNMTLISPTGNTREEDYACWYTGVSEGLVRDERQIILIKVGDELVGFFQYYTNEDTFMMEEIQLKSAYQEKGIFRKLYGFILSNVSHNLEFVEAYASINNMKSIGVLKNLGLENIGLNKNGRSYHFKGEFAQLLKWYESKN